MAMPIPERSPHADLLAWHERLEVPAGFRAEVIDGGISVSPRPSGATSTSVRACGTCSALQRPQAWW